MIASARACTPLPPQNLHGKEGVDGSSPSEGLSKSPANGHFVLPAMARCRRFAGTRRVHFGTGGHSRARATSRDIAWNVLETRDRATNSKSSCKQAVGVARAGAALTPSFAKEGVIRVPLASVLERRIPSACSGVAGAGPPGAERDRHGRPQEKHDNSGSHRHWHRGIALE